MKIRERRKCTMCIETFKTLSTSHRKTCSTKCSREYKQRPEIKAKLKEYKQRPEYKAKQREYKQRPEYKAKKREYQQRPEYKAKQREYQQRRTNN